MVAALLAALLALTARLAGWRGVDMAAQAYRVDDFRRHGFTVWDFSWYGGHWTLDYSIAYPALAATLGVTAVAVIAAGVAALAFDRLTRPHLGRPHLDRPHLDRPHLDTPHLGRGAGWAASLLFAAGTLVQVSIGQLPFLAGEASALAALWVAVATRRVLIRYAGATLLALLATACSPLAGAFLALAVAAWWAPALATRITRAHGRTPQASGPPAPLAVTLGLAAAGPVVLAAVLFPGDGPMPYPGVDFVWELVVAAIVGGLAWRRAHTLVAGAVLFTVAASVSEAVPSALGGNVGRIEDLVALPLAAALAWDRARRLVPAAVALAAVPVGAIPLALSEWTPAWGALTSIPGQPSTRAAFYQPLDRVLAGLARSGRPGRVEVVPTAYHWEAAYVAPAMPLARGWERQLDVADNPLFYRTGRLTPPSYRAWLLDNGVRFVALPSAPLDMAGRAEGRLVASGRVPGLVPVWSSADWRLYAVDGSSGLVSRPATLVRASGDTVEVSVPRAATVVVRIRYSPAWEVRSGTACVSKGPDSWITLSAPYPEQVTLGLSLLDPAASGCPRPVTAAPARAAGQ